MSRGSRPWVAAGGIAAVITPGNRAVAVRGDKVVGLAGLIRPRDRVDVLVTIEARDSGGKRRAGHQGRA